MRATVGDQLVQHGRVVGQQDKVGEIVEVMGQEGNPRIASASRTGTRACAHPAPTPRSGTGSSRWAGDTARGAAGSW